MTPKLARAEQIIDASGVAAEIEALLPVGVRPRQLHARTLLVGMLLTMLAGRDALLTGLHTTLTELPASDQHRLGVIADWQTGPHQLTYRQLEYTYRLITTKLAKDTPDGTPSEALTTVLDRLLEASVQVLGEPACTSYAVDWTAHETWSRPPPKHADQPEPQTEPPAPDSQPAASDTDPEPAGAQQQPQQRQHRDREASWGHRTVTHPTENEMFYGYYLQALTAVREEHGPEVPELVRRIHLTSCRHDPPAQIVPVIGRMLAAGIPIGDLLADSGYQYRLPETWALPLRALGTQLIMDLHPNDRGTHGTHQGAICHNGC